MAKVMYAKTTKGSMYYELHQTAKAQDRAEEIAAGYRAKGVDCTVVEMSAIPQYIQDDLAASRIIHSTSTDEYRLRQVAYLPDGSRNDKF